MSRPLLITDCDEVLVHMVRHFRSWLDEAHAIDFAIERGDFTAALSRRDGGPAPSREEMWRLLGGFFPAEMARQTLVPHAAEALARLAAIADIVILTNLSDACRQARIDQLAAFGIAHRVVCNQGGKGGPVAALVEEYGASVAVFVDDLAVHHESVVRHAPGVHRLHMIAEPLLAAAVSPAADAHARIDTKLAELGLTLPEAAAPVAAYVPLVQIGDVVHLSGQLPFRDGKLVTGRLGDGVSLEEGQEAAKLCGLMIVAQLKKHLGDLSRVRRIVKLGVFVNSAGDFTDQPKVANGASELMVALFGDAGRHARSAVGVPVLPLGAAVEVDAVVELGEPLSE